MSSGIGFFLMMIMMLGGNPSGPNDLLDMVPSEIYWQSKGVTPSAEQLERDCGPEAAAGDASKWIVALGLGDIKTREDAAKELERMGPAILPQLKPAIESKDADVSKAATALSKKLAARSKERAVRRLMAIRTLGEIKAKGSLPTLKLLADSKEVFVADYALRAMAQIEGKALPVVGNRKGQMEDLKLLPKDVGIVGQIGGMKGAAITVDQLADLVSGTVEQRAAQMQGMGGGGEVPDKKKLQSKILKGVLDVVEAVGNVRVDGMTMAVAEDVGPESGWAVLIFRGKGDSEAFAKMLEGMPTWGGDTIKSSRDGNIQIVDMGRQGTYILPSNEELIVISGPSPEKFSDVVKSVVAILKGGKGEFETNEEIAGLMKQIDPLAPIWAVGKLNAEMQKGSKVFEGVDTFTLSTKQGKESLAFTVTGQGSDADNVKNAADGMTGLIQAGIMMAKAQAEKSKSAEPAVALLESVKVTSEGKTATMSGEVKPDIMQFIMAEGPLSWMLMQPDREDGELLDPGATPDGAAEVPAPQP